MRLLTVDLPLRINRLEELAHNLWVSWHPQARAVFRALNYPLWRSSGHNPVRELHETSPERLREMAQNQDFLKLYDTAIEIFDRDIADGHCWFAQKYGGKLSSPIAYFSAEFAFHNSLPIYAGGLGVLAGDAVKEASDIALPMAAVGLMYPQGYFHQRLSAEGWQEETYEQLDFDRSPITACPWPEGCGPHIQIQFGDRPLWLGVWLVKVGRVNVYLLDTNVELNSLNDRQLSARLYSADREQRLQQEMVLGIGGVRALRILGINPPLWHGNEGHTSFMMLERVREELEKGASFNDAIERVRATSVFTTHTPVPAGHDVFSEGLMEKYFHRYWEQMGIDRDTFMKLGQHDHAFSSDFNMTILGLKLSERCNGVSQIHGRVSRKMWHVLWPDNFEDDVPIGAVTNGVHVPTWLAPEIQQLMEKYMGPEIMDNQDDPEFCRQVMKIPDEQLWSCHHNLKRKLFHVIRERATERWASGSATAEQAIAMGALLDSNTLTLGFVRRFVEYKRPTLLFQDIERLKKIVSDKWNPVQIVFAGKSHPADFPSKHLLHKVYSMALDKAFQGRIVFVEDYDIHISHYLTQGIDVWLNTPRRLQEASGTSGMKAGINGVLNLSVATGWWDEAYNGKNGWLVGDKIVGMPMDEDEKDAEELYRLLEQEIIPLYYQRNSTGLPKGWVSMMKESISAILPAFGSRRMMKEYTEKMYIPVINQSASQPSGNKFPVS
ncbi:MAG: alpha-glucan family phosphorylase, partial [Dehalococcoidia bacterium]|nr:alpha-glucan family phosphorylase [Dehalococcoidia bacterium]